MGRGRGGGRVSRQGSENVKTAPAGILKGQRLPSANYDNVPEMRKVCLAFSQPRERSNPLQGPSGCQTLGGWGGGGGT